MKTWISLFVGLAVLSSCKFQRSADWVTSTEKAPWEVQPDLRALPLDSVASVDAVIDLDGKQQKMEGFGACFNELGWISLSRLDPSQREDIMEELFFPDYGANFTLCRMPIGANDFSRDWYSYNETDSDFVMNNFTIANDLQTLIPFIKNAQKYNSQLALWASPWCPPSWMKYNKHYACAFTGAEVDTLYRNGLPADKVGYQGLDMFVQDSAYLEAYALYFAKFIEAYRSHGIEISAVMPQNEFNSAQIFPSCCWTATSLAHFIGNYLGPAMKDLDVDVLFGTMERADESMVDTVLTDPLAGEYIKGVGFQWAGKGAIKGIHERYPDLKLYQTEQECGDGKNDWKGAVYSWQLMKHYLDNGASAYMYWNISLEKGGISRWGWAQNSLVVVDPLSKTYTYTPEYYVLKHVSHYVQPDARKLTVSGSYGNIMAFRNPDRSLVIVAANEEDTDKTVAIQVQDMVFMPTLKAHSFSTIQIKQ